MLNKLVGVRLRTLAVTTPSRADHNDAAVPVLTIDRAVLKQLGWSVGDALEIAIEAERLVIVRAVDQTQKFGYVVTQTPEDFA